MGCSPSQRKAGLNWSRTMGEMGGLCHIFIDFYFPVLTPQHHWSASAFCKHNPLCSLYSIYMSSVERGRWIPALWGASVLYKLCRIGDRVESCGTPVCITLVADILPSTKTLNFLFEWKELISLIKLVKKCNFYNLYSKLGFHVVSEAFWISKNTAAVDILLFKFRVCITRRPHMLKYHAVTCTKAKLTCI